jgi:hypothetical protein
MLDLILASYPIIPDAGFIAADHTLPSSSLSNSSAKNIPSIAYEFMEMHGVNLLVSAGKDTHPGQ